MHNNWGPDFKGVINCIHSGKTSQTVHCIILTIIENVYMRLEVNSNLFLISKHFERLFHLHDNFTVANLKISNHSQKLFCLHSNTNFPNHSRMLLGMDKG